MGKDKHQVERNYLYIFAVLSCAVTIWILFIGINQTQGMLRWFIDNELIEGQSRLEWVLWNVEATKYQLIIAICFISRILALLIKKESLKSIMALIAMLIGMCTFIFYYTWSSQIFNSPSPGTEPFDFGHSVRLIGLSNFYGGLLYVTLLSNLILSSFHFLRNLYFLWRSKESQYLKSPS